MVWSDDAKFIDKATRASIKMWMFKLNVPYLSGDIFIIFWHFYDNFD